MQMKRFFIRKNPTRDKILVAAAYCLLAVVAYFLLSLAIGVRPAEGVEPVQMEEYAIITPLVIGAVIALLLRFLGVEIKLDRPNEAVPAIVVGAGGLLFSKTPLLYGSYSAEGMFYTGICACTYLWMLLLSMLQCEDREGFRVGPTILVLLPALLLLLAQIGNAAMAQWMGEAGLYSAQIPNGPLPHKLYYSLTPLVALSVLPVLEMETPKKTRGLLVLGLVGVALWLLFGPLSLLPGETVQAPVNWAYSLFKGTMVLGDQSNDALYIYILFIAIGAKAIWMHRAEK